MNQSAHQLRRTIGCDTTRDNFTLRSRNRAATNRTLLWRTKGLFVAGSLRLNDVQDFGNDLAALLNHYPVADLQSEALDFIFVVQSRARDGSTCKKDRLEVRHRRQCAGAPDLNDDR